MSEKEASWYGEATFKKLALLVAQLWQFVTIGSHVMILTVWVVIFIQNINVFNNVNKYYIGNDHDRYDALDGNVGSGYVASTNMPKQLGGAVFSSMFAIAMWFFILIAFAADISWRYPSVQRFLSMWHTPGIWSNKPLDELDHYYLFANGFLKLFIGVTTGSTSWRGLLPNNQDIDTEVFCLYACFIYLVNILFAALANVVCINFLKRVEWVSSRKADLESAAGGAAVEKYKAEEKEKAKKASEAGRQRSGGSDGKKRSERKKEKAEGS